MKTKILLYGLVVVATLMHLFAPINTNPYISVLIALVLCGLVVE
jgi:hypothetical protein